MLNVIVRNKLDQWERFCCSPGFLVRIFVGLDCHYDFRICHAQSFESSSSRLRQVAYFLLYWSYHTINTFFQFFIFHFIFAFTDMIVPCKRHCIWYRWSFSIHVLFCLDDDSASCYVESGHYGGLILRRFACKTTLQDAYIWKAGAGEVPEKITQIRLSARFVQFICSSISLLIFDLALRFCFCLYNITISPSPVFLALLNLGTWV